MGSIYYASLCFGMSQHSLWKDKEMSVAPMRQLTRHWFRVSIYFTDIASLNIYNDIIFSNQMHWSKGSYLVKYYRVRWWLTGWSACYLSTRTWVWIPAITQNPRHSSIDLVIPVLAFRDRKIPGACSPANLANRWAPHSARDPVSRKKVDNDRRHPTLTLASTCTYTQRKGRYYRSGVMAHAWNLRLWEAEAERLCKLKTNLTYKTVIRTSKATQRNFISKKRKKIYVLYSHKIQAYSVPLLAPTSQHEPVGPRLLTPSH